MCPYIVACGLTLDSIKCAFVVVKNHRYKVNCCLEAVHACFILHKVFHIQFSNICTQVWQFLEAYCYSIPVKGRSLGVNKLIDSLK